MVCYLVKRFVFNQSNYLKMRKNIVMITTMYPDQVRPSTMVCHYYTREWVKMGHRVIVFSIRSMFPPVYTIAAKLFPNLAKRIIGNHVEMDRDMRTIEVDVDGVKVYSLPIFKYVPHGNYPHKSVSKTLNEINRLLSNNDFVPNAIIGHFHNPTAELIYGLKSTYPNAKTSITFHITPNYSLRNYNVKTGRKLYGAFSTLGFRNKTLKEQYEEAYGPFKNTFICYSGTSEIFLSTPYNENKDFDDTTMTRFLYVGQFTKNKSICEVIEALHNTYPEGDFHINCIGDGGTALPNIEAYIKDNRLEKNVSLPGRKKREEIMKYYDESQVFVMISRQEAFGLVYLEAMSRGCICIGTRGQGIDGVIVDGENGFLCEGGNSKELETIIKRINELSPKERRRISSNARKTAEDLSEINVAKNYIEKVLAS